MIRIITHLLLLVIFEAAMIYFGAKSIIAAFGAPDGGSAGLFVIGAGVCAIAAVGGLAAYFGTRGDVRRVEI